MHFNSFLNTFNNITITDNKNPRKEISGGIQWERLYYLDTYLYSFVIFRNS